MIPSVISPEIKSHAEEHIFRWFENAAGTEEWVVLHSLGISNHKRVIHGEVDFFVLIPETGIFALEVKGGRVRREKGIWYFTDKYGHTDSRIRGPFDQAWEGIYSLRDSIAKRLDSSHEHLKRIFFGVGVMFPDVSYDSVGCDEEQWQVFDVSDGSNVKAYLERIAKGSVRAWKTQFGAVGKENRPSLDDIKYLLTILRGDFDLIPSLRIQYNYAEEELITLTENQYRCIDQLEDNARCLIRGAAGTGKTLLAIEEVKKAAARGERVGFLCFNNMLARWLYAYFEKQKKELRPVFVGTIHSYMKSIIQETRTIIPDDDKDKQVYFDDILPRYASNAAKKFACKFDRIIIDEAQDIMAVSYMEFIDSCLVKGIERGKWSLFGDFEKQAIYDKGMTSEMFFDYLDDLTGFARYKLTVNCRNSKNICEELKTVTGFKSGIPYLGVVNGPHVEYITFKDRNDEKEKLVQLLHKLKQNSVEAGRITLLSPYVREKSVVNMLKGINVHDFSVPRQDEITFSTIQGFKGLENTVIILCDIRTLSDKKLMYVAFSRARTGLYVLETEDASKEYTELYIRRNFKHD